LSRFGANAEDPAWGVYPAWAVRPLLAAVVECAARLGAMQLIGVTFLSMERLLRRIGVHAHRAGPAQLIVVLMLFACC
ncbi:acyl-homoserine-lactone synthase, partial [Burkholderia pseudomallei]